MLIPYAIETLEQEKPTANRVIMGVCVAVFAGEVLGIFPASLLDALVLRKFHPAGLIGHMFLHAGLLHLLGNMLFLWVLGNALCSNIGNIAYPLVYLVVGVFVASVHLLFKGGPAVGASGAISGVTGMILAMYLLNRVHLFWIAPRGIARGHNFLEVRVWAIVIVWLLLEVLWMVAGEGDIGYSAHIGGLAAGLAIGLACLQAGWVRVTDCDNRTLLDIIKGVRCEGLPSSSRAIGVSRHTQRRRRDSQARLTGSGKEWK